jgi:beta-glucanase (GH16 family)
MRLLPLLVLIISVQSACYSQSATSDPGTGPGVGQWRLVWSDEFSYKGLPDPAKWSYDVGGHGWGNKEQQFYTDRRNENARVENGSLIIEARRDNWRGHEYTSARVISKTKGDWTYGRFEVRAKLPGGKGAWPAIWMLPTNWRYGGWPNSGEIDIMEQVGYEPQVVHCSVHTKSYNHNINTHKTATTDVSNATTAFNVYAVEWTPDEIRGYVNDRLYFTFKNERLTNSSADYKEWPFDQPFHLLLNIAVGGTWGGAQGVDPKVWPQRMVIDYVRVYQPQMNTDGH